MDKDLPDRVRVRAYEIWVEGGYREGKAEQDWLVAEAELLKASNAVPSTKALRGGRGPRSARRSSESRVNQ